MADEITDIEKLLNSWYISHSEADDDAWFFDMIVSLNSEELLNTILCMYISNMERDCVNFNRDSVFLLIAKRVKTELLGNTVIEWRGYVEDTRSFYGELYQKLKDVLLKHMRLFVPASDKETAYQDFITELYDTYRCKGNIDIKKVFGRYLKKCGKEN